jgi:hypothetical protein
MEIVNGYPCRDCTDVAYAKKNIDPAHPKDPPKDFAFAQGSNFPAKAVEFGGALASLNVASSASSQSTSEPLQRLNLVA